MKFTPRLSFLAGLCAAAVLPALGQVERTVEKSFSVQPGGTLRVSSFKGEIRVSPSNDSTVKITARQKISAGSDAEADELLGKLQLTIEQKGSEVSAVANYEKAPWWTRLMREPWPPVSVDFTVTVPASFATTLDTAGGVVVVGDMAGAVSVRSTEGHIYLRKMGGEVDAQTSHGNMTLDEGHGRVRLATGRGSITVGRVIGSADISSSVGSIKVDVAGGTLRASTHAGTLIAGFIGPLAGECALSNSGGSVRVTVDAGAAFQLDAATSGGRVETDGFKLTEEKSNEKKTSVAGAANGGGPLLKVRTSDGDVTVKRR